LNIPGFIDKVLQAVVVSPLEARCCHEVNKTIDALAQQALLFRIRYRRRNVRWTYPRRFPDRILVASTQTPMALLGGLHHRYSREAA